MSTIIKLALLGCGIYLLERWTKLSDQGSGARSVIDEINNPLFEVQRGHR